MAQPTDATRRRNDSLRREVPFDDTQDFDDARRGFVATLSPGVIRATDGRSVWDLESFGFASAEEAPATVNPSLWRQLRLLAIHGLFEVVPGIYQVRGLDLSNITFVEGDEGDEGDIVIDPLISAETAAAAIALYREHRGDRPVTALIYTHSSVDHFGGDRRGCRRNPAPGPRGPRPRAHRGRPERDRGRGRRRRADAPVRAARRPGPELRDRRSLSRARWPGLPRTPQPEAGPGGATRGARRRHLAWPIRPSASGTYGSRMSAGQA